MSTPSIQKHLDRADILGYYTHVAKMLDNILAANELYKFPAEVFELLIWLLATKQHPGIEVSIGYYWHNNAIVIGSDNWWTYDIELVKDGINFSVRRTDQKRKAKDYSLGNLKRCFGAVFDETNFRTDLNSPELAELFNDAREVYQYNRQKRG